MTKTLVPLFAIIYGLSNAQERKFAFEFEYGRPTYGDKRLRRSYASTHYGLGLRFNPDKRLSTMVHIDYDYLLFDSKYEDRNTVEVVPFSYSRASYQKIFRVQKKPSKYNLLLQMGLGYEVIKATEPTSSGQLFLLEENSLILTGGIGHEFKVSEVLSIKLTWSPTITLFKTPDSINYGYHGTRVRNYYKSTNDAFNSTLHNYSIAFVVYPKKRTQDFYRKRDALMEARQLERKINRNKTATIGNITDLTQRISGLIGVSVTDSGANAQIVIRGTTNFKSTEEIAPDDPYGFKSIHDKAPYQYAEPIFVVNGKIHEGNYATLYNNITTESIKDVRVIKGPDTVIYGLRGANGVIEITTY